MENQQKTMKNHQKLIGKSRGIANERIEHERIANKRIANERIANECQVALRPPLTDMAPWKITRITLPSDS